MRRDILAAGLDNRKVLAVSLAVLIATSLLWPGDAPWINDDARLVQWILQCRRNGAWIVYGLEGSRGLVYGPFPAWIYSSLLHVCSTLPQLVRSRALLAAAGWGLSMVWISRLCKGLRPGLGAIALLSPYLWFSNRALWDNTFLIPLSGLALAACVAFCVRPRARELCGVALLLVCMFLTHPMSLAFLGACAVQIVWTQGAWLRKRRGLVAAGAAAAALSVFPYLRAMANDIDPAQLASPGSAWAGLAFPLFGGRIFSSWDFGYSLGPLWPYSLTGSTGAAAAAVWALDKLTWTAFPLVWLGMVLAARRVALVFSSRATRDADFHISAICLSAVILQVALDGITRSYGQPHYYNATAPCFFYFLWLALGAVSRKAGALPALAYAGALAGVLTCAVIGIHRLGGSRWIYGSSLEQQEAVARRLAQYSPNSVIYVQPPGFRLFPHALSTLLDFYELKGADGAPRRTLVVRYRDAHGSDAHLLVDDRGPAIEARR